MSLAPVPPLRLPRAQPLSSPALAERLQRLAIDAGRGVGHRFLNPDHAAAAVAAGQHGLITRRQAALCGLQVGQVDHRVRCGRWQRLRPGVYSMAGSPPTDWQAVLAACLAGGEGVVVSHATAAWLWLLDGARRGDLVHLLSPADRHVRLEGVVGHRTGHLTEADTAIRRRIPVTSVARTIVDTAGERTATDLGAAIDDAVRRHLTDLHELRACVARLAGPGRRRVRVMRLVLADRLPGYDPGDTNVEIRALRALARAGLPRPRQQLLVSTRSSPVRLDLAYPDVQVAVELDALGFHARTGAADRDRARATRLVDAGWRTVRMGRATTDDQLVDAVHRSLRARAG